MQRQEDSQPAPAVAGPSNLASLRFGAHLTGSAAAAIINFPLWKAAAIGQSGFREAADFRGRMRLVFGPPYKGVVATIFGMTWARAAIFYGSDVGKEALKPHWGSGRLGVLEQCRSSPGCKNL